MYELLTSYLCFKFCNKINFQNLSWLCLVFEMLYLYKNREFQEVLEPIRALLAKSIGGHIFAFLLVSYIQKKDSKSTVQTVCKRALKEESEKYDGTEDFIYSRIEEICSQEMLSTKEVIYFLCFLVSFLAIKWFLDIKV